MELEIRSCTTTDIELPLCEWTPTCREEVFFLAVLEIGTAGSEGADLFDVRVATPEGLRALLDRRPEYRMLDRALLIFRDYSWDAR